jgi:hypothetical protein
MRIYFTFLIGMVLLSSCSVVKTKSMNTINMKFCPMPAIPKGDYQAEASLEFKRNMVKDREFIKNYKQATVSSQIQPITVNLNQNTILGKIRAWLAKNGSLRSGLKLATDPTYEYAMYKLVEEYPNIDYWTNIRVDREVTGRKSLFIIFSNILLGRKNNPYIKTGTETVKVTATGIDILTDSEYEAFKKTPQFEVMREILFPLGTPRKYRN